MPTINQLAAVDTPSGGDNFPVYVAAQGDARRVSLTNLMAFIAANMGAATPSSVLASEWIGTAPVAVASLPITAVAGARAAVSDATQTLTAGIGTIVAGGGANVVPTFFDGTNWRIG